MLLNLLSVVIGCPWPFLLLLLECNLHIGQYILQMCDLLRHLHVQVGLKNDLPIFSPVDDAGVFTEEAGPFQGVESSATDIPLVACIPHAM